MKKTRRPPSHLPMPWLLWAAVVGVSLLAAYVHLLTSAIERGETIRRHQAGGGFIATANAATGSPPVERVALPPIPHSHLALIVVP